MSFRGQLIKLGLWGDGVNFALWQSAARLSIGCHIQTDVKLAIGSSSNKIALDAATDRAIAVYGNCTMATGTAKLADFNFTQGAGSATIIEALRVSIGSEYRTGSWANAIVGRIDYGSAGDSAGGLAAAICGEMNCAAKDMHNLGGAYYCFDAEMNVPTGCTLMTTTSTRPVSFMRYGAWGGAVGEFDDKGFLFHTSGLSAAADHLLSANSQSLRVNVEGTTRYMVLSPAPNGFGSRTSGSGMDLATFNYGLLVAAQYEDGATLANTEDYCGFGVLSNLHINREITLASGGGYGWASVCGFLDIDENINQTGGTSAAWFAVWMDDNPTLAGSSRINGVDIALVSGASFAAGASTKLHGLRIDSSINDSGTVSGEFNAIKIERSGSNKKWSRGISLGGFKSGIYFEEDPEAGENNYSFINIGTYDSALTVAPTTDHMFGVMHNVALSTNVAYWYQGYYTKITTSGTTTNTSVAGHAYRMVLGSSLGAAYGVQCHMTLSGTNSISTEAIAVSAYVNLASTAAITTDRVCALQAMIEGAGGSVTGDQIVAYIVNAGIAAATDAIMELKNQSACTVTSALVLDLDGTCTYALDFQGTVSDGWTSGDGAVTQSNEYVKIPVRVAGVDPTLYILAAETWS